MATLTELETTLAKREATLEQLLDGELVSSVSQGSHSSTFDTPTAAQLRRDIQDLKDQIAAKKGAGRGRGPIRMVF